MQIYPQKNRLAKYFRALQSTLLGLNGTDQDFVGIFVLAGGNLSQIR